jgi:predicted TIM-barrel fold metal-dependent hydrolase
MTPMWAIRPRVPVVLPVPFVFAAAVAVALLGASGCPAQPPPASAPAPAPDARPPADGGARDAAASDGRGKSPIKLADFTPTSMLHAEAHEVPRARFPVVDFHQHVNDKVVVQEGKPTLPYPTDKLLAVMDAANVRTLVILTGPRGAEIDRLMEAFIKPHPGRFVLFTQVDWSKVDEPNFGRKAAAQLRDSVARGARGLKVLKELGLYVRDRKGRLVAIDDPRWDPIWAECGRLSIPVAIHSGDPEAFFHPTDAKNERLEELWENPDWSFHGRDFPSLPALLAAQARVFARHPRTTFVALHFGGWPENLDYVSEVLEKHPNVYVETGARQAELGRQPRRARRFFLDHSDRILFGTDIWPSAELYGNYFRWLETADEYFPYFDYPAQGRFHIYGMELPENVLEKVYYRNAETVLKRR